MVKWLVKTRNNDSFSTQDQPWRLRTQYLLSFALTDDSLQLEVKLNREAQLTFEGTIRIYRIENKLPETLQNLKV